MANLADGDLKAGSLDPLDYAPISGSAVVYTAKNIKTSVGVQKDRQLDKDGKPHKTNYRSDFITGSATLEYPAAATPPPAQFATFTADLLEAGGSAPTWIVTSVDPSREQNGLATCEIGFDLKLN